jgi:hypothetical protein
MSCFFRYFNRRSAARQTLICIAVGCASASVAAAQSTTATFELPAAPQRSGLLAQIQGTAPTNSQDGRLDLSLRQALQMALKNNLDIELEQIDQTIADARAFR